MDSDLLFTLGVIALIVFLCREVNCWYLKINTRKELLEKMVENQKEIISLLKKYQEPKARTEENSNV